MITNYDELIPEGVLFNIREIDDMHAIKTDMTKKLIDNGKLEAVKIGTKLHISRTELIKYLIDNTILKVC